MEQYLSWEEIKKQYPDQWVLLVKQKEESGLIVGGVVKAANDDQKVISKAIKNINESFATLYTGKIPNLVGLSVLEIEKNDTAL